MSGNTTVVCLDSTHKMVKAAKETVDDRGHKWHSSAYLYTVLVKDKWVRKGYPLSFMICSSESQYVINACHL